MMRKSYTKRIRELFDDGFSTEELAIMHRTAVDAILDTVLAHLPPKKIPALNKREEGYNEAINKMEDILMSGKGKSHD